MQELYIDVQGKEPALVLIPGGGDDAGVFADAVPLLVGHRTVITYDRRGNSRSPLDRPDEPIDVGTQADDVIALLDRLGMRRAAAFGNSGGAIIALDLIARHSDRLTCAVVHESPAIGVWKEAASKEGRRRHLPARTGQGHDASIRCVRSDDDAESTVAVPFPGRARLVASGPQSMLAVGRILRALNGRQPDGDEDAGKRRRADQS